MTLKPIRTLSEIEEDVVVNGIHGIGDAIVSFSLFVECAKRARTVYLVSLPQYAVTLRTLYQDIENIQILVVEKVEDIDIFGDKVVPQLVNDGEHFQSIKFPGMPDMIFLDTDWDRKYYDHFDLPYSLKYKGFKLPRHIEGSDELYERLTEGETKYALIHNSTSITPAGYNIDVAWVRNSLGLDPTVKFIEIKMGITENLMHYVKLIQNATEMHVVPSSVFCLTDLMAKDIPAKLFLHDIRMQSHMAYNNPWNDCKWKLIHYDVKY